MDKRILIVEDDSSLQLIYKKVLEKEGFVVDVVDNVQSALESYNQNEYILFIVDILLKGNLTGDALIDSNLRPMLVVTALQLEPMYSTYYLRKPIRNKDLVAKVYEIIKNEYSE